VYGRSFQPGEQITTTTIAIQDLLRLRSFTNVTLTPIPDNNPTGATVSIFITTDFTFKTLSVGVDIEHTFIGDLTVSLLRNGTLVKVLSANSGGSTQNLVATYGITLAEIGTNQGKATWSLKVVDNAAQDVGKIRSF